MAFLTVREVQTEGGAQPKFNLAPPAVAAGLGIVVTTGISGISSMLPVHLGRLCKVGNSELI